MGPIDFPNLSYILLNSLRFSQVSMDGVVLSMNNGGLLLIVEGCVLEYSEFNLQEGSLKFVSLLVSPTDLKARLYPSGCDDYEQV